MPAKNDHLQEWLARVVDDEKSITAILNEEHGAPSVACFLAQQMVEKLLKAVLVAHDAKYPRVHNIELLYSLALPFLPELAGIGKELSGFTVYYFETRYVGDYSEFTFDEAREAFTIARQCKKIVEDHLFAFFH